MRFAPGRRAGRWRTRTSLRMRAHGHCQRSYGTTVAGVAGVAGVAPADAAFLRVSRSFRALASRDCSLVCAHETNAYFIGVGRKRSRGACCLLVECETRSAYRTRGYRCHRSDARRRAGRQRNHRSPRSVAAVSVCTKRKS